MSLRLALRRSIPGADGDGDGDGDGTARGGGGGERRRPNRRCAQGSPAKKPAGAALPEVAAILKRKRVGRNDLYWVKWAGRGRGVKPNSWEPRSRIACNAGMGACAARNPLVTSSAPLIDCRWMVRALHATWGGAPTGRPAV